jgi:hypothetical protein
MLDSKQIYIIEMPGKPPREVTNIKIEVVERLVSAAGGKIYPKPIPKIKSIKSDLVETDQTVL